MTQDSGTPRMDKVLDLSPYEIFQEGCKLERELAHAIAELQRSFSREERARKKLEEREQRRNPADFDRRPSAQPAWDELRRQLTNAKAARSQGVLLGLQEAAGLVSGLWQAHDKASDAFRVIMQRIGSIEVEQSTKEERARRREPMSDLERELSKSSGQAMLPGLREALRFVERAKERFCERGHYDSSCNAWEFNADDTLRIEELDDLEETLLTRIRELESEQSAKNSSAPQELPAVNSASRQHLSASICTGTGGRSSLGGEKTDSAAVRDSAKQPAAADDQNSRSANVAVPREPTEAQWSGLARDIMMWLDMERKTPRTLFDHLDAIGVGVPPWLRVELEMGNLDSVPSKGTRCVILYKAMLAAVPAQEQIADPARECLKYDQGQPVQLESASQEITEEDYKKRDLALAGLRLRDAVLEEIAGLTKLRPGVGWCITDQEIRALKGKP